MAVPTMVAEVIALARDVIEAKRTNATLSYQNTDMDAELVEARTFSSTMRKELAVAERRIAALKTRLGKAQSALEKLTGESSSTEAGLHAQGVAVEEALSAEKARVERLERDPAARWKKGSTCWPNVAKRVRQRVDCRLKIGSRVKSYSPG